MSVHAVEQFWTFYVFTYHIVIAHHRTDVEVTSQMEEETTLDAGLPSLHLTLIAVVISHIVTHAPVVAGKGVEIDGIVGTVLILREYVSTSDAQHVESYSAHIPEE